MYHYVIRSVRTHKRYDKGVVIAVIDIIPNFFAFSISNLPSMLPKLVVNSLSTDSNSSDSLVVLNNSVFIAGNFSENVNQMRILHKMMKRENYLPI